VNAAQVPEFGAGGGPGVSAAWDAEYEALEAEATKLVPLLSPWDSPQPSWGLGSFGTVEPSDDGRHRVWMSSLARRGLGTETTLDLDQLRAAAITLLVYCEAHRGRETR